MIAVVDESVWCDALLPGPRLQAARVALTRTPGSPRRNI